MLGGRGGLGLRSNLELDASHTEVLERGDHRALLTRACPQYWEGNCLLLDAPPAAPGASEQEWARAIADWRQRLEETPLAAVGHAMLRWETDGGDAAGALEAPRARLPEGVTFAQDTVLVYGRAEAPAARELPASIQLRLAERDEDWRAIVEMVLDADADAASDLDPDAAPAPDPDPALSPGARYTRWAYASARATFTRTGSPWFTAWDGPLLVGSLGLFHGPSLSRFQEVETRRSHRGRGIASALLTRAIAHAAPSAAPSRPLVIVAETDGAPERLYRRLGFTPVSRVSSLSWELSR